MALEIPETIPCVDCGRSCGMLGYPPEDGWQPGDIVTYRCSGCGDRWDMEVGDEEL